MAENLKALKKRLRSIQGTEHITHAMEMVSANKFRRTEAMYKGSATYFAKIEELILPLADEAARNGHPLVLNQNEAPVLFVVIAADRGLCGSFNNNIVNFAAAEIKKNPAKEKQVYLIGKKAKGLLNLVPDVKLRGENTSLNGKITLADSQAIMQEIQQAYLSHEVNRVYLIGNHAQGGARVQTYCQQFLPFSIEEIKASVAKRAEQNAADANKPASEESKYRLDYIFEPSPAQVLNLLLEEYVAAKLYNSILEQFMCEHRLRMIAMNNATKSCQELNKSLTLKMNKARQSSITTELLDIVAGAEALN